MVALLMLSTTTETREKTEEERGKRELARREWKRRDFAQIKFTA